MDVNIAEVPAFTTLDGSEIRKLLPHRSSQNRLSTADTRILT